MFLLIVIGVSIFTACLPLFIHYIERRRHLELHPAKPVLPIAAAVLFFISFYLPDIGISSETTTFQQHAVGGGMYSALLYIYFQQILSAKLQRQHWIIDSFYLFAWVSALGVANKLLEFALLKTRLIHLDTSDAYWDLLANTFGAFLLYYIIRAISAFRN